MVTIGMNYFVRDGKDEIFEAACAKVIDLMADIDGHDESDIYRRVDRSVEKGSPVYLVVSRWANERAFRDFVASDAFKKVTDWGKLNILTGPPKHTTYHE